MVRRGALIPGKIADEPDDIAVPLGNQIQYEKLILKSTNSKKRIILYDINYYFIQQNTDFSHF